MIVWSIQSMKTTQTPEEDTVTEAVYLAQHSAGPKRSGAVAFGQPGQSFVAFGDLTEATVLGWVWQHVNKAATESFLNAQATQDEAAALPWAAT